LKNNSLRSFERVKHLKTIERLFSKDAFFVYGQTFGARFILDNSLNFPLQVGFSVSKRHYKKAVDRNKIKRWMREIYRVNKGILQLPIESRKLSVALFMVLNKKLDVCTYTEVEKSILELLSLISKKIERHAALDKTPISPTD
jgi:ribonuclease P protein component